MIAAAVDTFVEKMARSEQQRRYQRIEPIFSLAASKMEAALADRRFHEVQELLEALGREQLAENGDWVSLHRDRDIPAPK